MTGSVGNGLTAFLQKRKDGHDPSVNVGLRGEGEFVEQRVDVLLHRPFRQEQGLGDGRVVLPLGHLLQDLPLPLRELPKRRVGQPVLPGHQALDHFGIEHRAAPGDLPHGPDQLVEISHSLLEQIAEPGRAVLEKLVRVIFLGVLGEHDDPGIGMSRADLPGRLDTLGAM